MNVKTYYRWGVLFRKNNLLDGYSEHLVFDWKEPNRVLPVMFRTRREARSYAKDRYGYIRIRKDLREEPYGWKAAKVVKVNCSMLYYKNDYQIRPSK